MHLAAAGYISKAAADFSESNGRHGIDRVFDETLGIGMRPRIAAGKRACFEQAIAEEKATYEDLFDSSMSALANFRSLTTLCDQRPSRRQTGMGRTNSYLSSGPSVYPGNIRNVE